MKARRPRHFIRDWVTMRENRALLTRVRRWRLESVTARLYNCYHAGTPDVPTIKSNQTNSAISNRHVTVMEHGTTLKLTDNAVIGLDQG